MSQTVFSSSVFVAAGCVTPFTIPLRCSVHKYVIRRELFRMLVLCCFYTGAETLRCHVGGEAERIRCANMCCDMGGIRLAAAAAAAAAARHQPNHTTHTHEEEEGEMRLDV